MTGESRQRIITRFLAVFPWLVLLFIAGATLFSFTLDFYWRMALLAHFRPQYVVVSLVLLPFFFIRRAWIGAVACLAVGTVNFWAMSAHLEAPPKPELPRALRLVSANVLMGNTDNDAIGRFLIESDADVIVLQEVSPEHAEFFKSLLPQYPGQFRMGRKDSKGVALLTRWPLKSARFEPLPGQTGDHAIVGALTGEIEGPTGPFTILGIHSHKPTTQWGTGSQKRYFSWLAEQSRTLNAAGKSVIVAGDFNSTPWARPLQDFARECKLVDTSRGTLFGATWRVWRPYRLMIDHVFVSPDWTLISRKVGSDIGSDHNPLIVDLAATPAPSNVTAP